MCYTSREKANVCKLIRYYYLSSDINFDNLLQAVRHTIKFLRTRIGYEKLKLGTVLKWYEIYTNCQKRYKWKKKWKNHYIQVDWEFEERVWSKLIVANLEGRTEKGVDLYSIAANITTSYDIIKLAASETQKEDEFKDRDLVKKLKFTSGWVTRFLNRARFTRKKVNSKPDKKFPSATSINEHMAREQEKLKHVRNLDPRQVWNYDETAWYTEIKLDFLYSPAGIKRTKAPPGGGSNRDRITLIPLINGAGELGPVMAIVKDSSSIKKGNQGNMKVLDYIKDQFNRKEGAQNWQTHTYKTTLPYTKKAKKCKEFVVYGGETVHRGARPAETINKDYTIKYIRHEVHGHVICSQANAYNDTLRHSLYIDVVLRSIQSGQIEKFKSNLYSTMVIWSDNVSSHSTQTIKERFKSTNSTYCYCNRHSAIVTRHERRKKTPNKNNDDFVLTSSIPSSSDYSQTKLPDIIDLSLPEYTTCYLQPCDVLLNKLIKDIARRNRNISMYEQFQEHRKLVEEKKKAKEDCSALKFTLKVVNYKESLYEVINFYDAILPGKVGRDAVSACFIRCGLFPEIIRNNKKEYHQFNLVEHQKTVQLKVPPVYLIKDDDDADVEVDPTEVDLADYLDDVVDVVLTCDDEVEYIVGDQEEEDEDDTYDDENGLPLDEDDACNSDEEDDEEDV